MFFVGNEPRILELKIALPNYRRQGDSVFKYYGKLKKNMGWTFQLWGNWGLMLQGRTCAVWKERDATSRSRNCTSFFLDLTTLHIAWKSLKLLWWILYLVLIMLTPLLSEKRGIKLFPKEEIKNLKHSPLQHELTRKDPFFFTVCTKSGHLVENCYQVVRYPNWWGDHGKGAGSMAGRRGCGVRRNRRNRNHGSNKGGGFFLCYSKLHTTKVIPDSSFFWPKPITHWQLEFWRKWSKQ